LQPAQLAAAGVSPEEFTNPRYVPVRGVIEDVEMFDAKAFGISDREAQIMDPQHRLALEYAVTALEDAGYDPARTDAAIGVFAGSSVNSYLANNVLPDTELCRSMGALSIVLGNEKDHLATRIAYRLGLRGPAVTVQTACSTSLVAIHLACQSIRSGECDMAIAGGVCVAVPQHTGHLFSEQGILSPDGRCRAFDRRARSRATASAWSSSSPPPARSMTETRSMPSFVAPR
jgi:acyl transferase domain-containing protein